MVKKEGLPKWGEFVLCTVKRITPYAAWCDLDEYTNVEGMIHVSEVAGKWVHDIRDFVKINKKYVAKVVRIDYQKRHLNLSLKRVSKQDERKKMNEFRREKRAEKILEQAAKELKKNLDQAYEEVGFLLQKEFGELFAAFEEASKSKDVLLKVGVPQEWAEVLNKIIEKSFQEKEVKLKADVNVKIFSGDGIEKIKQVLSELERDTGATVKYISAPKYRVELKTNDPKADEKKLVEALEKIVKRVKELKGEGSYKLVR